MKDLASRILVEDVTEGTTVIDIQGMESITASFNHVADTEFSVAASDNADMSAPENVDGDMLYDAAKVSEAASGAGQEDTAGSVTDTTAYPVESQAGKEIDVTIDGAETATNVAFTTAIDRGYVESADAVAFPLDIAEDDTITLTTDGGADDVVTFAAAIAEASPSDVVAQIIADVGDDYDAEVIEEAGEEVGFFVMCKTGGASAAITAATIVTGLTFKTAEVRNTAAGIASEVETAIGEDGAAEVVSGQMKVTSATTGAESTVAIAQGSTASDLTFAAAVAGFGQTWDYLKYSTTGKGRVAVLSGSKRYLRFYLSGTKASADDMHVIKNCPHFAPIS